MHSFRVFFFFRSFRIGQCSRTSSWMGCMLHDGGAHIRTPHLLYFSSIRRFNGSTHSIYLMHSHFIWSNVFANVFFSHFFSLHFISWEFPNRWNQCNFQPIRKEAKIVMRTYISTWFCIYGCKSFDSLVLQWINENDFDFFFSLKNCHALTPSSEHSLWRSIRHLLFALRWCF